MQYALIILSGFKMEDYQKSTIGKLTNLYQNVGKPATIQIESSVGGRLMKEDLVIFGTVSLQKEGAHAHNIDIFGYVKNGKDAVDSSASRRMRGSIDFMKKLLTIS